MFPDDVFLVGFGDGAILVSGFFSTEDFEITKFYSKFKCQNLKCHFVLITDKLNQVFDLKFISTKFSFIHVFNNI